jgi:hypothetical protein
MSCAVPHLVEQEAYTVQLITYACCTFNFLPSQLELISDVLLHNKEESMFHWYGIQVLLYRYQYCLSSGLVNSKFLIAVLHFVIDSTLSFFLPICCFLLLYLVPVLLVIHTYILFT